MEPEERMAFFITKAVGERARQRERWGDEHDDLHKAGELARAAAYYSVPSDVSAEYEVGDLWPFFEDAAVYEDRLAEIATAVALLIAEAERLMRAKEVSDGPA